MIHRTIFVVVPVILALLAAPTYAEGVVASSTGIDKTALIEFDNTGDSEIETFRMWLGAGASFKSFKTEIGWSGTKTPQGVLVFTADSPLAPGETVRFGIKADMEKPGVNWKALDGAGAQLGIGKILVSDIPSVQPAGADNTAGDAPIAALEDVILPESSFRLIPDRPSAGSPARVAGEKLAANQNLDLYLGGANLGSAATDESGSFILTVDIPAGSTGRADLSIRDAAGNERTLGVRIGDPIPEKPVEATMDLTITSSAGSVTVAGTVSTTGTGTPGSTVTVTLTNPDDEIIISGISDVDDSGKWSFDTPIPPDSKLGTYTTTVTDGKNRAVTTWNVEDVHQIQIEPILRRFEPGDTLRFNGTAVPGISLEVVIESPQGSQIHSDVFIVNSSGVVVIETPTALSYPEGTYVLFATQSGNTEIVPVGLGEQPKTQLIVTSDKTNYRSADTAHLTISGISNSMATLIILNQADAAMVVDATKTDEESLIRSLDLGLDGRADYTFDLSDYKQGIYTAVVSRGNAQATHTFTVDLNYLTSSSQLASLQTIKEEYLPGESIIILGDAADRSVTPAKLTKNVAVTLTLIDPNGERIKSKETYINEKGKLSDKSFRIPLDGIIGTWVINAQSGSVFKIAEFAVVPFMSDELSIMVTDIDRRHNETLVTIMGLGAESYSSVNIDIFSGVELIDSISSRTTSHGSFELIWRIPDQAEGGISYVVNATDSGGHNASTTVSLE